VGPAYKEVATKYTATLQRPRSSGKDSRVEAAVSGRGPMPPNNVPDADLKTLVAWIWRRNRSDQIQQKVRVTRIQHQRCARSSSNARD
jgi:cytochrome c551/c552